MAPIPTLRQLGDRLDQAFALHMDGERDGDAFVAAFDTREDGYDLALKGQWANDREAFLEDALDRAAQYDRDLIAAAFWFRLAELDAELARAA